MNWAKKVPCCTIATVGARKGFVGESIAPKPDLEFRHRVGPSRLE